MEKMTRSVCPARLMIPEKLSKKNRNTSFVFYNMEILGDHFRTGFIGDVMNPGGSNGREGGRVGTDMVL